MKFVISAPGTSEGKTLVATALCAALRRRGHRVQPYKIGPDYIDARFYERVAGRPAYNVDLWLDGEAGLLRHVKATMGDADVLLFEGMMGLFDGDDAGETSTARVALALDAPVIIVLDLWRSSQTAAAVALGLRSYEPRLRLAGVILNRVGGARHENAVRAACGRCDIRVLAAIATDPRFGAADRALGLDVAAVERRSAAVEELAGRLEHATELMELFGDVTAARAAPTPADAAPAHTRIAYARDDAFWFTYPETLASLRIAGLEPVPFSPLLDDALPERIGGLWLSGGYPELHAPELERNVRMRDAVAAAVAGGIPTYAECGGMMYLAETLVTADGTYAMVGSIRGSTSMLEPRLTIGYRQAKVLAETPFDAAGSEVRGYEYHYARAALEETNAAYAFEGGATDGYVRENLLAAFMHRRFLPGSAEVTRFAERCRKFRD